MKELLCEKGQKLINTKSLSPKIATLRQLSCFIFAASDHLSLDCQPDIHQYKENSQAATQLYSKGSLVIFVSILQGGSNMTGTDLYVNKPHCAAAVRP